MKRLLALAAVVALAAAVIRPESAQAHAALISSEPVSNAFLKEAPASLVMRFNEPLDTRASGVQLLAATGTPLTVSSPQFTDGNRTMTVTPPALPPGVYAVIWLNVSTIDGHPISGTVPFTVLNADGTLPSGQTASGNLGDADPTAPLDSTSVRAVTLLALILVVASVAVVLLAPAPAIGPYLVKLRLFCLLASGLLLGGTLLSLPGIRDTYSGRSFSDLLTGTPAGGYFVARMGLTLLIAVTATFLVESPRRAASAALASVAVYLWCFTATSHAAAASGSGWAMAFDVTHAFAATLWLGAVLSLGVLLRFRRGAPELGPVLPRMALLASACVYLILGTGVMSSLAQIDSLGKLTDTNYGVVLLLKLGLAIPLLAVAGYNARWGRRAIIDGSLSSQRFVRSASLEVGAGLLVVLGAAVLTQSVVPRSIAATSDSGVQSVTVQGLTATLQAAPNVVGINSFRVDLEENGQPANADRVRLTFRPPTNPNAASTIVLESAGGTTFLGSGAYITQSGDWSIDIEVRRPGADDLILPVGLSPQRPPVVTSTARWGNPAAGLEERETLSIGVLVLGMAAMYTGVAAARFLGDRRLRMAGSLGGIALIGAAGTIWAFPEDSGTAAVTFQDDPLEVGLRFEAGPAGRTLVVGEITNNSDAADWIVSASFQERDIGVAGALDCSLGSVTATTGMPIPLPAGGTATLRADGCRLELDGAVGAAPGNITVVLNSGRRLRETVEANP